MELTGGGVVQAIPPAWNAAVSRALLPASTTEGGKVNWGEFQMRHLQVLARGKLHLRLRMYARRCAKESPVSYVFPCGETHVCV